jgi:hypothetical protein
LNREEGEDLLATAHLPAAEGGVLAAMGDVGGKGLKAAMAVSLIEARVAARNRGDNRHQTASRHRSCISAAIIRLALPNARNLVLDNHFRFVHTWQHGHPEPDQTHPLSA